MKTDTILQVCVAAVYLILSNLSKQYKISLYTNFFI